MNESVIILFSTLNSIYEILKECKKVNLYKTKLSNGKVVSKNRRNLIYPKLDLIYRARTIMSQDITVYKDSKVKIALNNYLDIIATETDGWIIQDAINHLESIINNDNNEHLSQKYLEEDNNFSYIKKDIDTLHIDTDEILEFKKEMNYEKSVYINDIGNLILSIKLHNGPYTITKMKNRLEILNNQIINAYTEIINMIDEYLLDVSGYTDDKTSTFLEYSNITNSLFQVSADNIKQEETLNNNDNYISDMFNKKVQQARYALGDEKINIGEISSLEDVNNFFEQYNNELSCLYDDYKKGYDIDEKLNVLLKKQNDFLPKADKYMNFGSSYDQAKQQYMQYYNETKDGLNIYIEEYEEARDKLDEYYGEHYLLIEYVFTEGYITDKDFDDETIDKLFNGNLTLKFENNFGEEKEYAKNEVINIMNEYYPLAQDYMDKRLLAMSVKAELAWLDLRKEYDLVGFDMGKDLATGKYNYNNESFILPAGGLNIIIKGQVTEEMFSVLCYAYKTKSKNEYYEFVEMIKPLIDESKAIVRGEDYSKSNAFLKFLKGSIYSVEAGYWDIGLACKGLGKMFTGDDSYTFENHAQMTAVRIQQIDKGWYKYAFAATRSVVGMSPSMIAYLVPEAGPYLAVAYMALYSAGNTYVEGSNSGLSHAEATCVAVETGAVTAASSLLFEGAFFEGYITNKAISSANAVITKSVKNPAVAYGLTKLSKVTINAGSEVLQEIAEEKISTDIFNQYGQLKEYTLTDVGDTAIVTLFSTLITTFIKAPVDLINSGADYKAFTENYYYSEIEKSKISDETAYSDNLVESAKSQDELNQQNIKSDDSKHVRSNYEQIIKLLPFVGIDENSFINTIQNMQDSSERNEYLKKITDSILEIDINNGYGFDWLGGNDKNNNLELSDEQYQEIFKYSSMEDYLKKFNFYIDDLFEELKLLEPNYIFNMPFSFSTLCDSEVLSVVSTFGLKNVVEIDNECGQFFSKNNCENLKLMSHYMNQAFTFGSDLNNDIYAIDNGKKNYTNFSKDQFYESMRRMIIYGYYGDIDDIFNAFDYGIEYKYLDYRDIVGEFRERNDELFISEEAPEELKNLFYNRQFSLEYFAQNPQLIEFIGETNIACGFPIEMSWLIDCFNDMDNQKLANDNRLKIISLYSKIEDNLLKDKFKNYIISHQDNFDIDKVDFLADVILKLSLSNSSEIYSLKEELVEEIMDSENPLENLNQIENIFKKNTVPTIGKIYSCFETLHPDFKGFDFLSSNMSPVLKKASLFRKKIIIFTDLIKANFGSNNRNVKNYLNNIEISSKLYEQLRTGQIQYEQLSDEEKSHLIQFRNYLSTLYNSTMKSKQNNESFQSNGDVLIDILELSKKLSPNGTLDYNLEDRVVKMFCGFAGIDTLEQAKQYIYNRVKEADARNREAGTSDMILEQGDFVKGVGDIKYLGDILQNGSISKEYLGASSRSDNTPLDTDVSMIIDSYDTVREKIESTQANIYGPIYFILKNDDRFINTRNRDGELAIPNDLSKLEVFYTGVMGPGHYGIRTGFASTDINYIVMEKYDYRVGLEIAMNGFYIPVADMDGKIVFTPEDYDNLRKKMNGLSYYDMGNYVVDSSIYMPSEEIMEIMNNLESNKKETLHKENLIKNKIQLALSELDLSLKNDIDLNIGSAVLFNTGSTGRFTNIPGDGDFDYVMQIDRELYSSKEAMEKIRTHLINQLSNGKETTYSIVDGDIRELKTTVVDDFGNEYPVEIDITFTHKTDKTEYASDVCIVDRFNNMVSKEEQDLVKANIIYAKEFLKSIEAYKPARKFPEQGGLGGIGVENWILQNGGSFYSAAVSFVEVAEKCETFDQFKELYSIPDFGFDHMADKKGFYLHDNYLDNMNKIGYEKMLKALKEYLETAQMQ